MFFLRLIIMMVVYIDFRFLRGKVSDFGLSKQSSALFELHEADSKHTQLQQTPLPISNFFLHN
jgi:hypothetical protein